MKSLLYVPQYFGPLLSKYRDLTAENCFNHQIVQLHIHLLIKIILQRKLLSWNSNYIKGHTLILIFFPLDLEILSDK